MLLLKLVWIIKMVASKRLNNPLFTENNQNEKCGGYMQSLQVSVNNYKWNWVNTPYIAKTI